MTWATTVVETAMLVIALAMLMALVRLLRGPSLPDRVVALDLLTIQALGIVCGAAILYGQSAFLDAAIILALLAFLSTIAFARHVERRALEEHGRRPRV